MVASINKEEDGIEKAVGPSKNHKYKDEVIGKRMAFLMSIDDRRRHIPHWGRITDYREVFVEEENGNGTTKMEHKLCLFDGNKQVWIDIEEEECYGRIKWDRNIFGRFACMTKPPCCCIASITDVMRRMDFKVFGKRSCSVFLVGGFLAGIAMLVLGYQPKYEYVYVCGDGPPALFDFDSQGISREEPLPVCVMIDTPITDNSNRKEVETAASSLPVQRRKPQLDRLPMGPLCRKRSEDGGPPIWCNQVQSSIGSALYWSSCEICGAAWRIFSTPQPSESWFKLPTTNSVQPLLSLTSLQDDWLAWDNDRREWFSTNLTMTACNSGGGNSEGVPDECYAKEDQSPSEQQSLFRVLGILLMVFLGPFFISVTFCQMLAEGCPTRQSCLSFWNCTASDVQRWEKARKKQKAKEDNRIYVGGGGGWTRNNNRNNDGDYKGDSGGRGGGWGGGGGDDDDGGC